MTIEQNFRANFKGTIQKCSFGSGTLKSLAIALALFTFNSPSLSTPLAVNSNLKLSQPLQEACNSQMRLDDWKFKVDPKNEGKRNKWASVSFDDRNWKNLRATRAWQEQGFPNYHGSAWYRLKINIPANWRGSKIIFHSEGIKEEYDLFLNGKYIRHFGSKEIPTGDVPTEAELSEFIRFGSPNLIAIAAKDHGKEGGIWRRTQLRRVTNMSAYKHLLPEPILDSHPELVDLYWQTWKMAWQKVSFGDRENGFVSAYMEEGYSEQIFQWDSIFISMYGRYGKRLFPAMPTLDNFYIKQDPDGYIQRIYSKTSGKKLLDINPTLAMTNPPIFAWSEWDYFKITGDKSRLSRVFPILERYFAWIKKHQSSPIVAGMYWQTDWETGMDNMPRPNTEQAGCVDMTLQQALSAKYLKLMAEQLHDTAKQKYWQKEFESLRDTVNHLAWSSADGIYYDVDKNGKHTGVRHIGAFWSLISNVASKDQAEKLVAHLKDPKEFYRKHLFPALAASDPNYTKEASYWAGGVWAPTDYMVIKGLQEFGYDEFAREAALNHISNMAAVYASNVDLKHIDPNEADGDYHTIWECYNPDKVCPCTRADKYYFGRQDFAGWTGVGPISLLIEQVIGMNLIGSENRILWKLDETKRVGLKNFELGNRNIVSLVADSEGKNGRKITCECQKPFTLKITKGKTSTEFKIQAGKSSFQLK